MISMEGDRKSGIFLSPSRGLVKYDAVTDTFQPVGKENLHLDGKAGFPPAAIHTVFGDTYLLLNFLEKSNLISVLRTVFPKKQEYERLLCHILHGILKDGSKMTCDNFIQKSFASYILPDIPIPSLRSDTGFYNMVGDDHVRLAFFSAFISEMRKKFQILATAVMWIRRLSRTTLWTVLSMHYAVMVSRPPRIRHDSSLSWMKKPVILSDMTSSLEIFWMLILS